MIGIVILTLIRRGFCFPSHIDLLWAAWGFLQQGLRHSACSDQVSQMSRHRLFSVKRCRIVHVGLASGTAALAHTFHSRLPNVGECFSYIDFLSTKIGLSKVPRCSRRAGLSQ